MRLHEFKMPYGIRKKFGKTTPEEDTQKMHEEIRDMYADFIGHITKAHSLKKAVYKARDLKPAFDSMISNMNQLSSADLSKLHAALKRITFDPF